MPEILFATFIAYIVGRAIYEIGKAIYSRISATVKSLLSTSDWRKYLNNERLPKDRWRVQHTRYLRTTHWRNYSYNLRKKYSVCQVAGCKNKNLEVHHLNYDHPFQETEDDTVVLCGDLHHDYTHQGKSLVLKNGKVLKPFGR
jgi:hypothetical protein